MPMLKNRIARVFKYKNMDLIKDALWSQFGASIDMLINAISGCPDDYLQTHKRFFYIAFHSVIFLDYYLTFPPSGFAPSLAFSQRPGAERPIESIGDLIPDRFYTQQELIGYLQQSRIKCKNIINNLNVNTINDRFIEGSEPDDMNYSVLEILLYNLRHTQHHTAQLNLLIRQDLNKHTDWYFKTDDKL